MDQNRFGTLHGEAIGSIGERESETQMEIPVESVR